MAPSAAARRAPALRGRPAGRAARALSASQTILTGSECVCPPPPGSARPRRASPHPPPQRCWNVGTSVTAAPSRARRADSEPAAASRASLAPSAGDPALPLSPVLTGDVSSLPPYETDTPCDRSPDCSPLGERATPAPPEPCRPAPSPAEPRRATGAALPPPCPRPAGPKAARSFGECALRERCASASAPACSAAVAASPSPGAGAAGAWRAGSKAEMRCSESEPRLGLVSHERGPARSPSESRRMPASVAAQRSGRCAATCRARAVRHRRRRAAFFGTVAHGRASFLLHHQQ